MEEEEVEEEVEVGSATRGNRKERQREIKEEI